MTEHNWWGSFCTPMTPYDANDHIDVDALAAEVQFCVESGVGGLCMPVMVSEFRMLSEDERKLMVRVPLEVVAGRIPIVANCAAVNTPLAVEYARYCEEQGAAAVIAMPPYIFKPDFPTIYEYYHAISDAVSIPVWIQNAGVTAISPDQVVTLCTEIENVSWVKEEVFPSTHNISAVLGKNCPHIEGVMGGAGGRYLIHERNRGSRGVIHACQFCDILQRVWDLLDEGKQTEAEDLFDAMLPGIVLEGIMGMAYAKEIMVRRGVLKNNRIRTRSKPLDEDDMREIDRVYARMEPYFLWHKS